MIGSGERRATAAQPQPRRPTNHTFSEDVVRISISSLQCSSYSEGIDGYADLRVFGVWHCTELAGFNDHYLKATLFKLTPKVGDGGYHSVYLIKFSICNERYPTHYDFLSIYFFQQLSALGCCA
jgi:hypothetical protein